MSVPRTTRQSVLVIRSPDLGWPVLLEHLSIISTLTLAAVTDRVDKAAALVTEHEPDLILVGDVVGSRSTVSLTMSIRTNSLPGSRIVVVGSRIDEDELAGFLATGVSGYLLWRDLTGETLGLYLSLIAEGATIYSPSVAPLVIVWSAATGIYWEIQCISPNGNAMSCNCSTARRSRQEIARELDISESTVKRNIEALTRKLEASGMFVAGARAALLGYLA